jgi:putative addiction module CopG family antidote
MTVHLPDELERFVRNEVQSGHFASDDEAISEAVRLLWRSRMSIPPSSKPLTEEQFEQRLRDSGLRASAPLQGRVQPVSPRLNPSTLLADLFRRR